MKIVQSLGLFKGRSTFSVDKYDALNLSIHSLTRKSEYKFPLDQIDHRYEQHKEFSFKALAALIFFIVLALYFFGLVGSNINNFLIWLGFNYSLASSAFCVR